MPVTPGPRDPKPSFELQRRVRLCMYERVCTCARAHTHTHTETNKNELKIKRSILKKLGGNGKNGSKEKIHKFSLTYLFKDEITVYRKGS